VVTFRLRRRGAVDLVVRNASCTVVGSRHVSGRRGVNRVRFNGRVHGRPLAPGRYTLVLVAVRGSSRTPFGAIGIQVVPPGRRLTEVQRSAPVAESCFATAPSSSVLPAPVVTASGSSSVLGPVGVAAGGVEPVAKAPRSAGKTGVLGVSTEPKTPSLLLPLPGSPRWLGVTLFALFGFAFAVLVVLAARFVRDAWKQRA
jgi:hypothetical protein